MSFASLKKAANKGSTLSKLTQEIEKLNQPQTTGADERLWKPELDKSGNGYAVIRFLPAPDGEDMPWAKIWSPPSKDLVVSGTSRTLLLLLVRMILSVN